MAEKPIVVVGRRLPPKVEARLARDYRAKLNPDDRLYTGAELLELLADADAILPCHTERLDAAAIARLPESVRIIANFSVGVDHCDLAAAKERGIVVTHTPDVLSDATAEGLHPAPLGRCARHGNGGRAVARALRLVRGHGGRGDLHRGRARRARYRRTGTGRRRVSARATHALE